MRKPASDEGDGMPRIPTRATAKATKTTVMVPSTRKGGLSGDREDSQRSHSRKRVKSVVTEGRQQMRRR